MATKPALHLLAKGTGPAIVGFAADNFTRNFVNFNGLAERPNIGTGFVKVDLFAAIDSVNVIQKLLDCFNKLFVGRSL